jgi:hypothetical protein
MKRLGCADRNPLRRRDFMHYAGIGSRDLTSNQLRICELLGEWFAMQGHTLHSGNAPGADQALARGANSVNPKLVNLSLPWYGFERHAIVDGNVVQIFEKLDEVDQAFFLQQAEKHHPKWERLTQGARKLHARNGMIIRPVGLVLAFPSSKPGGGGTGQGMRIARAEGVELIDLNTLSTKNFHSLCERFRSS